MVIGLGVTCEGGVAAGAAAGLAVNGFAFGDGTHRLALPDVRSKDAELVLDRLETGGARLRSFNFSLTGLPPDPWAEPDAAWVSAVLVADDLIDIDPANTFDPVFPAPCHGLVPPPLPVRILGRPRGHFAAAKHERVMSETLRDFLSSYVGGTSGDVLRGDAKVGGWCRYFPDVTLDVIEPNALRAFRCLACGTAGNAYPGVWLGRRVDGLTAALHARGMDHLNAVRLFVLSVPVARRLEMEFGEGYGLSPVVDAASEVGQRVAGLLPRLRSLSVTGIAEVTQAPAAQPKKASGEPA